MLDAHQRGFLDSNSHTNAHRSLVSGQAIRVSKHDQHWSTYPLLSDEELFQFYVTSYIFRSIYHDQLWRWMQLFPREQIKIIQAEAFFKNPKEIMLDVIEFLGLEPYTFCEEDFAKTWGGGVSNNFNPQDYEALDSNTRSFLTDFFKPYNEKLFELIGEEYNWQ